MTYRDPNTERERNLGQEEQASIGSWVAGFVVLGALAFGGYYFYTHSPKLATLDKPSSTAQSSSSTGSSTSAPKSDSSGSTGASSGTSGSDVGSQPAQDTTGVVKEPGTMSAPAGTPPAKSDESKPQ